MCCSRSRLARLPPRWLGPISERVRRHWPSNGVEHAGVIAAEGCVGGAGSMNERGVTGAAVEGDDPATAGFDEDGGERAARGVGRHGDQDATIGGGGEPAAE